MVRAYAQEGAEIAAFSELNWQYAEKNLGLVRIDAVMRPLMQFLIGMGFVLIIWAGVPLAVRGEITVGQFTVFNMYLARLIWPLIALGYVVNLYQRGTASLKRMNPIFAMHPSIADTPDVKQQPPIQGKVEFRNLTFSYHPNDEPVLRDINLTIPAGQTVAFVGRTGSGKSTLMNLIPRVVEAEEADGLGTVEGDGGGPGGQAGEEVSRRPDGVGYAFTQSVKFSHGAAALQEDGGPHGTAKVW